MQSAPTKELVDIGKVISPLVSSSIFHGTQCTSDKNKAFLPKQLMAFTRMGTPVGMLVEHYAAQNIAPAPKYECYGNEVVANTNEALPCVCQA